MPVAQAEVPPVIATASSAGGIHALIAVLASLPEDLPAAVMCVQHVDREHKSYLPEILRRQIGLPVHHAGEGEKVAPGTVYIGPPDVHLLLDSDGTIALTHTELVHFVRPSADLLFESVAAAAGPRALAVVLSGSGQDGALGTQAIHERGGYVVAQDEETAEFFGMPGFAISNGFVDEVLPLDDIAGAVLRFVERCTA
jgi:two-component system chemotaxis response regulator CheB